MRPLAALHKGGGEKTRRQQPAATTAPFGAKASPGCAATAITFTLRKLPAAGNKQAGRKKAAAGVQAPAATLAAAGGARRCSSWGAPPLAAPTQHREPPKPSQQAHLPCKPPGRKEARRPAPGAPGAPGLPCPRRYELPCRCCAARRRAGSSWGGAAWGGRRAPPTAAVPPPVCWKS